jgi:magnesium-transporting ATPase (P-type)
MTLTVSVLGTMIISGIFLKESILSMGQALWISWMICPLVALALASEKPREELLNQKIFKKEDYLITPSMIKMIFGQSVFQIATLLLVVFLGEHFLIDFFPQRQLQYGKSTIVSGTEISGFDRGYYREYSIHFTYVFNILVIMTIFNCFHARSLDRRSNILKGLSKSSPFLRILAAIFALQVLFVTLLGPFTRGVAWVS